MREQECLKRAGSGMGRETVAATTGSWVERGESLDEAERRARRALVGMGLRAELAERAMNGPLFRWSCVLRDTAGNVVPLGKGLGKGRCDESRTGALYEALEHYLTGPASFDPAMVRWAEGSELAAGALGGDMCAPVLAQMGRVACHAYARLGGGAGACSPALLVPAVLTTSWYYDHPELRESIADEADYAQLARYGSNSGSAIGSSLHDALLHALNETIERDAMSHLLASAWPAVKAPRVKRVDPATLPSELAAAHRQAEELRGQAVHIFDATTDIGVPTFVAAVDGPVSFEMRFGAGTSLSPHHALWRALGELLQGASRRSDRQVSDGLLHGLKRYPALYACAVFDVAAACARADLCEFPRESVKWSGPEAQLEQILALLAKANYQAFYRTTATAPENLTAVHVFVPGLERFMVVTSGMAVVPGPRARAWLSAGRLT
ncbi:YcaO-like family protein [Streptomyces sp. NPDC049944]|uniref:YcaO-like family protein n=1 Tax=Streptomyces sp. NPDC049944 TaxID=3155657 RepID=UPI003414A170